MPRPQAIRSGYRVYRLHEWCLVLPGQNGVANGRQCGDLPFDVAKGKTLGVARGLDVVALVRPDPRAAGQHRGPSFAQMLPAFEIEPPGGIAETGVGHLTPVPFGYLRHAVRPEMPQHLHPIFAVELRSDLVCECLGIGRDIVGRPKAREYMRMDVALVAMR